MSKKLNEGINAGDLDFLISNKIHFDEYNSKMGRADSVVTASFKVKQREPALDLVSFLETGYDWILDADISSGEIKDGEFIVFLEMQRRKDLTEKVIKLLNDLQHLTNLHPEKWQFKWYKQAHYQPVTEQNLTSIIPTNPKSYRETIEQFTEIKDSTDNLNADLSRLKILSGV